MLNQQPILIASPSQSRGFYEVRTTEVTLSYGRNLLDHLLEHKEGDKALMALSVRPQLDTNSVPVEHSLYSERQRTLARHK